MAQLKIICCVVLTLCCFSVPVLVLGSSESDHFKNLNSNLNPNLVGNFEFSRLLEYLETQEKRIRELEKSGNFGEEGKSLKSFYGKVDKLNEKIDSLSKKLDALALVNEKYFDPDQRIPLFMPPLKGEPGQKGEQGAIGLKGKAGEKGEKGPKGERGFSAPQPISSCSVVMETLPAPRSKRQTIQPHGNKNGSNKTLEVFCDFESDGGGWTIIQKRSSGPEHGFDRNWTEYSNGFGSPDGNFWLGLENIHALTKNGDQELRIELEDFQGNKAYAKYSHFVVSDAYDFYRLSIVGFYENSTAGDSMTNSKNLNHGMRFSTNDQDNDHELGGNCAVERGGGWWFNACSYSNLNGPYRGIRETNKLWRGIRWSSWKGLEYSLAKTEMKIRTRKFV